MKAKRRHRASALRRRLVRRARAVEGTRHEQGKPGRRGGGTIQAANAEGELRKAAAEALKRNGLPDDLIERTRTLPGTLYEHAAALPGLPGGDRANLRKAFKDFAGFPVRDFDRLTGAGSGENGDGGQGRPVEWDDPEPWPEPVDGAELLDALKAKVEHYAVMPEGGAEAVTLWALYTWPSVPSQPRPT